MKKMAQPWFKFYPANFVDATYTWKPEVVGIYLRLLMHQYKEGFIPRDVEEILEICNCSLESWNRAWKKISKKFDETDEGFVNQKMDKCRNESENSYARRVKAAKLSHESRKRKNCIATCNANASASGSGSNSASSSSFLKVGKNGFEPPGNDLPFQSEKFKETWRFRS